MSKELVHIYALKSILNWSNRNHFQRVDVTQK